MEQYTIKFNQINHKLTDLRSLNIGHLYAYQFEKIALIGGNGTGKTTLLNMIAQKTKPESGTVETVGEIQYFEQLNMDVENDFNTLDGSLMSELHIPMHTTDSMSGGEKAKYKLANVISNYSPILLLDEPTSAMDNISEFEVFSNLLDEKRTVITVAHRISTVRNFDKIILMDNGEIVCIGKHEDLIENSELYRSLYYKKQQFGGTKWKKEDWLIF